MWEVCLLGSKEDENYEISLINDESKRDSYGWEDHEKIVLFDYQSLYPEYFDWAMLVAHILCATMRKANIPYPKDGRFEEEEG
jgi:hypothetical protein